MARTLLVAALLTACSAEMSAPDDSTPDDGGATAAESRSTQEPRAGAGGASAARSTKTSAGGRQAAPAEATATVPYYPPATSVGGHGVSRGGAPSASSLALGGAPSAGGSLAVGGAPSAGGSSATSTGPEQVCPVLEFRTTLPVIDWEYHENGMCFGKNDNSGIHVSISVHATTLGTTGCWFPAGSRVTLLSRDLSVRKCNQGKKVVGPTCHPAPDYNGDHWLITELRDDDAVLECPVGTQPWEQTGVP